MAWAPFVVCFLSLALVFAAIFHESPKNKNESKRLPAQSKWHRTRRSVSSQGKVWKRDFTTFVSDVMDKLDKIDDRIEILTDSIDEVKINVRKLTESCEGSVTTEMELEKVENEMEAQVIKLVDAFKGEESKNDTNETQITIEDILPVTSTAIPCINASTQEIDVENVTDAQNETNCPLKSDQIYDDCASATENGESGHYLINLPFSSNPTPVYCDGQWLVIQRRILGHQTFNKNWQSYKNGFGDPCDELWVGNELVHNLTSINSWSLTVEFWHKAGFIVDSALYTSFRIGSEKENFTLYVDGYQPGGAKDGFFFHNGSSFVTADHGDNHIYIRCAILEESGWWYAHTQYLHFTTCNHHLLGSNLNAPYAKRYKIITREISFCTKLVTLKFSNSLYWRGRSLTKGGFHGIRMKIKMN